MDFNKIIEIIKSGEHKVLNFNDIKLPSFSDLDLLDLLKQAVYQKTQVDNYANLQALGKGGAVLTPKLIKLINSLSVDDYLQKLAKFPASFRITNIQLYYPEIRKANQKIFKKFGLVFTTNLYFTPNSNYNGLGLHTDSGHLFVHQIRGKKNWTLLTDYKDGEYLGADFSKVDLAKNTHSKIEFTLEEDQTLYLPYVIPHQAYGTMQGPSVHLTYAFKEIPMRNDILNFSLMAMRHDLNLNKNIFEVLLDNESKVGDKLADYFNKIKIDNITKKYNKQKCISKMDILVNGINYD